MMMEIKMRQVVIYEQIDIFGESMIKASEKIVLIIKRKSDGKYLIKNWWKKKEQYTEEEKDALKYRKRNFFPQTEKEIKKIIKRSIKKRFDTEEAWQAFLKDHQFEQIIID